jgi:catechol 2,3-dioxygenase-like lactoylglutathione lyase family enzyme
MSRIERAYVIDFAVRDMHAAADKFSKIFGIEGVRMSREQDPEGYLDGIHFPVGGINALGIMTYLGEPEADSPHAISKLLATRGEGVWVLGHLVDDIAAHSKELVELGFPVPEPEPLPYADGHLIFTGEVHGTLFEFATHHSDAVSDIWRERHRNAHDRRIERAYRIDVAVHDLEAATDTFTRFLGMEATPAQPTALDPAGTLRGVRVPIGGLDDMNLVTPDGTPQGAIAEHVSAFLDSQGEGALLMGFEVKDLERAQREIEALGIRFGYSEPQPTPRGRTNVTEPISGVMIELAELHRGA